MWNNSNIKSFFYTNWFYGICVLALSIETIVVLKLPRPSFIFFVLSASGTVAFYNRPYIRGAAFTTHLEDDRLNWYRSNTKLMQRVQQILFLIAAASGSILFFNFFQTPFVLGIRLTVAICSVALCIIFYYGIGRRNLRSVGWLKPFVLGYIWAGVVVLWPIVAAHIGRQHLQLNLQLIWYHFVFNFLFIAALCVLFDVKDTVKDAAQKVYTIPYYLSGKKLAYFCILPLTVVLCFLTKFIYDASIILLLIPIVLFVFAENKKPPLIKYLVAVDGLMLLKAIFGIVLYHF
jgi:hypothetical protein